jgi:hypothetical protein
MHIKTSRRGDMTIKSLVFTASLFGALAMAPAAMAQHHGGGDGGGDRGGYAHGGGGGGYAHGGDRDGDRGGERGDYGRGGYGGGPRGYYDGGHFWHWYAGYGPPYGYDYPPAYYVPPPIYYAPQPYYYAPPVITVIP